jgi:hypothetical protein
MNLAELLRREVGVIVLVLSERPPGPECDRDRQNLCSTE